MATLGYSSRACYVKFPFDNERASTWQQGWVKEAFDYFGACASTSTFVITPKALIVKRDAYAKGEHKLHVEMLPDVKKL